MSREIHGALPFSLQRALRDKNWASEQKKNGPEAFASSPSGPYLRPLLT
jgi:hypothetical protein